MANEKRLIYMDDTMDRLRAYADRKHQAGHTELANGILKAVNYIHNEISRVDAVELPKGKPGDYLEWDNGTGFRQIYHIHAVMICEDCIRYDLEKFSPVVNHPNIVRILSLEEAEQEWREMCDKAMPREEPTMTACVAKMDGDGNGL